jgi:hypothetical protein
MLSVLFSLTQAQQVPAVPSACLAVWNAQKTAVESACKITVNSNLTDFNTLNAQLNSFCTHACGDAITRAGAAVAKDSSCSSLTIADGFKVADFVSYVPIFTSVACMKLAGGNGYCLPAQLERATTFNLTTGSGQKSAYCTDCLKKQISAIVAAPRIPKKVADIIQPMINNVTVISQFFDQVLVM